MSDNKTVTVTGEYKGNKTLSIYKADEEGLPVSDFPIITIGKAKAKALVAHIDDLKEFAEGE